MEYLISTIEKKNCIKSGIFWIEGDFEYINEKGFSLLEGIILDSNEDNDFGYFNKITYNKDANILQITNDKRGQLSLYYFEDGKDFVVSNNVWKLLETIGQNRIELNNEMIIEQLAFCRVLDGESTVFTRIKTFKPAIFAEYNKGTLSIKEYWDYTFDNNSDLTIDDAVTLLDEDIKKLFRTFNKDKIYGFGNSGGLDSRLIALYLKEFGLKHIALTIGKKRPNKVLLSQSHHNAKRIAKVLGFTNNFIEYDYCVDWKNRNLLDIRNNPFGMSNIFKNPYNHNVYKQFDILIAGQPGTIMGAIAPKLDMFDFNTIIEKLFLFYSKRRMNIKQSFFFKAINVLKTKKADHYVKKAGEMFHDNIITDLIGQRDKEKICVIHNFFKQNSNKTKLNIWLRHINNNLAQFNYNAGFESLNRLCKSFYLYYPFAFENIMKWKQDFLFDRKILKRLIIRKSVELASLRDQFGESLLEDDYDKYKNPFQYIFGKIILFIRGTGLEYRRWVKNSSFQTYARSVISRENPLFYKVFEKNAVEKSLNYPIAIEIVKLKEMLDIIYYNEYPLLNREEWKIQ